MCPRLANENTSVILYIIQIISRDGDYFEVSYMKPIKYGVAVFKSPEKKDVYWVTETDIVKKLDPPVMKNVRMGHMEFKNF